MRLIIRIFFIVLFSLTINYTHLYSCTTFCLKTEDENIFGRNYDWSIDYGIVFVNKRSVVKIAFAKTGKPVEWISKYGSVTFNQFGREFPTGGMNESGLVVELMWLEETEYPDSDDRSTVGGILQWIQYQLDNCETIAEVIDSDEIIRIPEGAVPVHYLISDRFGNSATIEFLKGKMITHYGEKLPHPVLTNDTYSGSADYLNQLKEFGGEKELVNDKSSLYRFAKTCSMLKDFKKGSDENADQSGFKILDEVNQGEHTKWSIVYDIKNMEIYYRTLKNREIKIVDFKTLSFDCNLPVMMTDINDGREGKINDHLKEYSYDKNRELIERSYSSVDFLKDITNEMKDLTAAFPDRYHCVNKSQTENIAEEESYEFKYSILFLLIPFLLIIFIITRQAIKI
ncbi:MAG: linear amide C-N hydrolase [Ignavibacteria bacterium]|nr:linear amide C-N hydrolase [Ignavibacteria bacterium]